MPGVFDEYEPVISNVQRDIGIANAKVFNNTGNLHTLSNVLAKTIFSIRPYSASMKGLEKSLPQWGAYMRKFNIVASDWKDDDG